MTHKFSEALIGILTLISSGYLGVIWGGIYCNSPDALAYGTGHSVRSAIRSVPKLTGLISVAGVFGVGVGLCLIGPYQPVLPELRYYAVSILIGIAGFSFTADLYSAPLPEFLTVPFLCWAISHSYPDYAAMGDASLGFATVLLFRYILGAAMLGYLVLADDNRSPRLLGLVSEQHWFYFAGAAAWVGFAHLQTFFVILIPFLLLALALHLMPQGAQKLRRLFELGTHCPEHQCTSDEASSPEIPWSGAISVALLLEMVSRREAFPHLLSIAFAWI